MLRLENIRINGYLQADRTEVEARVAAAVQADPQRFIDAYIQDDRSFGGRYIAADLFKEMFPEYRASRASRNRYNNPLHNAAAVLSAALFRQQLASGPPEQDTVIFLTGIPGAGKTSSVLTGGELPPHCRAVFEGQLSNPATTFEKIQQVLDAGLKVQIVAVHALPENALMNTFRRFREQGRGASIHVMSAIQSGLPACLLQVHQHFGDQVALQVNDYRDRANHSTHIGWAHLKLLESEGTYDQIRSRLSSALQLHAYAGTVDEACRRQAAGEAPVEAAGRDEELERASDQRHESPVG